MKRKGNISPLIETRDNFELAYDGYPRAKHSRISVAKFEKDLDKNLNRLLESYKNGTWKTSEYEDVEIHERKSRIISKLPIDDHVIQWAACLHVEPLLCSTFIRQSCSCVKGRGTHDFIKLLKKDFNDVNATRYFVQLDAHHFFMNISHDLMKEKLRKKIKDNKLLTFLDEFIDSYYQGLPLGVKISQILANYFLAYFDRMAIELFDIIKDNDKMAYWRSRYVNTCLLTCRTPQQATELAKGVNYLNSKFDRFVSEGAKHYFRFADNIVILHEDKTFLHIITEIVIMVLARDFYIKVNKDWNVRPVYTGIDVCGYVSFHDHVMLRKTNKKGLCRQVAKLRKKGYSSEKIRIRTASRIGFATHADAKNLLRKLDINMEKRLGTVIRNRKLNIPFVGMRFDQKKPFSEIVCKNDVEEDYKIFLMDYKIEDSKVEKEDVIIQVDDGNGGTKTEKVSRPKKCLCIRYKKIKSTTIQTSLDGEEIEIYEFEKECDKDGRPKAKDAEFYSYTGSTVLIEQAGADFTKEDLPCPTVITEFTNKLNKKFYKFT